MRAVAVTKPGQIQIVDVPQPSPRPYEVRIKTEAACLCNATDRKLIEGHFPGVESYPLLLGHETVGVVDAVGENVRSFKIGDRVIGGLLLRTTDPGYASGWGGFSEYVIAGDHQAMVKDGVARPECGWYEVYEIMTVVPHSLALRDAVMLCTWREVLAAFGDFRLQAADDIVVYGAGPVGLSFIKFARLRGLGEIISVETRADKRELAVQMGATAAFAPDDPEWRAWTEKRATGYDALIDAVGRESIINAALPLVKMGGSICVYGVIDTPSVLLEKSRGPYNFNLLVHQWPTRFRERLAQDALIEWVRTGQLSYREFISAEFPIEDIAAAFELSKGGETIKILFHF